jgi:hypothetical protein
MKVFIQKKNNGEWLDINCYSAQTWFIEMGYEIIPFVDVAEIYGQVENNTPVVGGIGSVKKAIESMGKTPPAPIDIPEILSGYTNRKVWVTTLKDVHVNENLWPIFIKPLNEGKLFTGHVIKSFIDLIKTSGPDMDLPIIASEVVKWEAEYRCFVLKGEVIDARRYQGDINWYPNIKKVQEIADNFTGAPVAYSIDVGLMIDSNGNKHDTSLVEVNDGYSLGIYGLPAFKQVKMIIARWNEMTK